MKLSHLFETSKITLLEVKARIEHPEDLIWDSGSAGARQALHILAQSAARPEHVSVKWDGSPALVAGWLGDKFMLTDKAGFSAKGYNGLTTSAQELEAMILNRKIKLDTPEARESRQSYARKIAKLYPLLKKVIPPHMQGFVQGDLLWTETPDRSDGDYVFQPNKIKYEVPISSPLGEQMARSKVGIVFHSRLDSQEDHEPSALRNPTQQGILSTPDVVVMPHEMNFTYSFQLNDSLKRAVEQMLTSKGAQLDEFFNSTKLAEKQIKGLPMVMKSFLAHKAGEGDADMSRAGAEFLNYLDMPKSKVSEKAKQNMLEWIKSHEAGYETIWQLVALIQSLKLDLKAQMDDVASNEVKASLGDLPGHEGFVSVTPSGTIKLVNRSQFMKKELTESDQSVPVENKAVFTFMRVNPPKRK